MIRIYKYIIILKLDGKIAAR